MCFEFLISMCGFVSPYTTRAFEFDKSIIIGFEDDDDDNDNNDDEFLSTLYKLARKLNSNLTDLVESIPLYLSHSIDRYFFVYTSFSAFYTGITFLHIFTSPSISRIVYVLSINLIQRVSYFSI